MHSNSVLSLFSGAGGFSFGFSQYGLKPLCGADVDADACATCEANVGSPCHNLDLSTASPDFFKQLTQGRQPLAIIGGPPCQGFSTAGPRNTADPRNKLIFNYLHIVNELSPRWFVFENVEGLLTEGQGDALFALVREFLRIGYSVRLHKVNFAAYGLPQTRTLRPRSVSSPAAAPHKHPHAVARRSASVSARSTGIALAAVSSPSL